MYHYGIKCNNAIHCKFDLGVEMGRLTIITCTVIVKVVFDECIHVRVQEVSSKYV